MSESEDHSADRDRDQRRSSGTSDGDPAAGEETAEWFAASTLRIGLAIIGFVLLLFALGQAVGLDLLGLVVEALNTRVGRWLMVAFFALLLIMIALRGFTTYRE